MKIRKFVVISALVLSSFAANNVAPSKAELESMYDKAFREFNANNFPEALKGLDAIDARQPDLAESQNLRGVIQMRQGSYDQAEQALQKALATDPKFWNARFNLAEIPFLKKDWAEARNRFQGLLFGNDLQLQGEALQLIQYKILLTYLLENKENMVDSLLSKLELTPDTPAVHYANAAIAFQRKDEKEAKNWLTAAEKNFTPQLNKLFAESLYEVGWIEKPVGQTRAAVELTSAADRAAKAKALARAKFDGAEQAFAQRDFTAARKLVDEADAADPNQASYLNLRGEILLAQKDFDAAEAAFKQAAKVDPKFREAQFNLAQIPFKKKDYTKARERYEALFGSTPAPNNGKDQTAQLIKFKVFLTLLLEGKDSRAQKMMEQFQFTGDTPALYYAQAAWEFKHSNATKANDWVTSARKIYAPAMNMVFADAFYDLGWLQNAPAAAPAAATDVAKAEAAPAIEPSPIPGAALAASTTKQPAQPVVQKAPVSEPAASVAGMEATTQRAPVVAAAGPAKPVPAPSAANSPTVQTTLAANASPAESRAVLPKDPGQPEVVASAPPVIASKQSPAAIAPSVAPEPIAVAKASPAASAAPDRVATAAATASPATVLAPATVRDWSKPTASETLENYLNPHTLLITGLLLAAAAILAWVVVPVIRRRGVAPVASRDAEPVTPARLAGAAAGGPNLGAAGTRAALVGGPRHISLQLKATEPSVRRSAVPFSKGNKAFGAAGGAAIAEPESSVQPDAAHEAERAIVSTGELGNFSGSVSEPREIVSNFIPAPTYEVPVDVPLVVDVPAAIVAEPIVEEVQPEPVAMFETVPAVVEAPVAEVPAHIVEEAIAPAIEPVAFFPEIAYIPTVAPEIESAPIAAFEPVSFPIAEAPAVAVVEASQAEPIGQGQPVPHLIAAEEPVEQPAAEPTRELTRPVEGLAAGATLAGLGALRHSVETPVFASTVVSTESSNQNPTPPAIMPPTTPTTPAPAIRTAPQAPASGAAPQPQTAGGMQTAVQLTFSLEIASLQLTPSFKMGALQLRPTSKIVTMRLAPSQQPQPAMNLQVTFEIANVQLAGGALGTLRLTPSQQQRPTVAGTSAFNIAGLQLLSGADTGAVQLTPAQQGQGSVQLTARFQIATVEFSPSFEIAALVLNSASRTVAVQLPGSTGAVEAAPMFDIANVQLGGGGEIGMLQLSPQGSAPKAA